MYWHPDLGWSAVRITFAAGFDSSSGTWSTGGVSLPSGADLLDGAYEFGAYVDDNTGNRSDSTIAITVSQSAAAPAAAVVVTPTSGAAASSPSRSQTTSAAPVVSGITAQVIDHVLQAEADLLLDFEELARGVLQPAKRRAFLGGP
jgi:hypothetical protein